MMEGSVITAEIEETVERPSDVAAGALAAYGDVSQLAVGQSLAVSLARAEIDQQIATARAMPRSIRRTVDNILTLATLDRETSEECLYALPRGGKPIKGPSVRLAEIINSQWGNCRVGARVVHVDRVEKYVEAEGVFHDLETNAATTARVRRRISGKDGRVFNDDMIIVTGNAACAIAKRNAILGAVPKAVWRKAYQAVESVIAGDVKTLVERRDRAMKAFAAFGVKPEQVFAAIGVSSVDEVTVEHMATLTGMHSALKNGEATVEEMFSRQSAQVPPPPPPPAPPKSAPTDSQGQPVSHDPQTGEVTESAKQPRKPDHAPTEAETEALRNKLTRGLEAPNPVAAEQEDIPTDLLRKPQTPEQLHHWAKRILDDVKHADDLPHAWEKIDNVIDGDPALKRSYEDMVALYQQYERKLAP